MSSRASEQGTGTAGPRRRCGRGPHAPPPPNPLPSCCLASRGALPDRGPWRPAPAPSGTRLARPGPCTGATQVSRPGRRGQPAQGRLRASRLLRTVLPGTRRPRPRLAGTRPRGTGPVPLCVRGTSRLGPSEQVASSGSCVAGSASGVLSENSPSGKRKRPRTVASDLPPGHPDAQDPPQAGFRPVPAHGPPWGPEDLGPAGASSGRLRTPAALTRPAL